VEKVDDTSSLVTQTVCRSSCTDPRRMTLMLCDWSGSLTGEMLRCLWLENVVLSSPAAARRR